MILAFYSEASGTGKDTAANYAAERLVHHGFQVVRDAFAWDGKVVAADALGIEGTREEKVAAVDEIKLGGTVEWEYFSKIDTGAGLWPRGDEVTGRDFLIGLLGSPGKGNGVRGLDEGFWTRQVVKRAQICSEAGVWTVISDLRFTEEADAVKLAGGYVVEIVRDDSLGKFNEQRLPTETIDHTIWNTGSLDDFRSEVNWFVDFVLNPEAIRSRASA